MGWQPLSRQEINGLYPICFRAPAFATTSAAERLQAVQIAKPVHGPETRDDANIEHSGV